MNRSESIKELAASLAKFQEEVENPKNTAKNPQFNSKYAPLEEILKVVRPILGKNNLSILQDVGGDLENIKISTLLLHSSGEWVESESFLLKGEQTLKGGSKVLNIQGAGSMITYAKRYQIASILGIQGGEDDDGNQASKKVELTEEEKAQLEAEKLRNTPIVATKVETLRGLIETAHYSEEKLCEFYELEKLEDLPNHMFVKVMKSLEKLVREHESKTSEIENTNNDMPEI